MQSVHLKGVRTRWIIISATYRMINQCFSISYCLVILDEINHAEKYSKKIATVCVIDRCLYSCPYAEDFAFITQLSVVGASLPS